MGAAQRAMCVRWLPTENIAEPPIPVADISNNSPHSPEEGNGSCEAWAQHTAQTQTNSQLIPPPRNGDRGSGSAASYILAPTHYPTGV